MEKNTIYNCTLQVYLLIKDINNNFVYIKKELPVLNITEDLKKKIVSSIDKHIVLIEELQRKNRPTLNIKATCEYLDTMKASLFNMVDNIDKNNDTKKGDTDGLSILLHESAGNIALNKLKIKELLLTLITIAKG